MSADQNRNKKPLGKSKRDSHDRDKRPGGKPMDNDQPLHQPYQGYDEEKGNRTDYSQQIGEFSNWSKRR
jgi:hypothetical protein